MRQDFVATGSDGDYPYFGAGIDPMGISQHIRTYASFTTKLRRYAIDQGVVSLPHAIRSCTGLPAEILGWSDRGLIETGNWADITVFDPASLAPRSTVQHLHRVQRGSEVCAGERVPRHRRGAARRRQRGAGASNTEPLTQGTTVWAAILAKGALDSSAGKLGLDSRLRGHDGLRVAHCLFVNTVVSTLYTGRIASGSQARRHSEV